MRKCKTLNQFWKSLYTWFTTYLKSRDSHFPLRPELWLRANGTIPMRSWFIARLRKFFSNCIAGQSMRAGGATALAEAGVAPNLIQTVGRWTSETFTCYVHKNPFLFEALLIGRSSLHSWFNRSQTVGYCYRTDIFPSFRRALAIGLLCFSVLLLLCNTWPSLCFIPTSTYT